MLRFRPSCALNLPYQMDSISPGRQASSGIPISIKQAPTLWRSRSSPVEKAGRRRERRHHHLNILQPNAAHSLRDELNRNVERKAGMSGRPHLFPLLQGTSDLECDRYVLMVEEIYQHLSVSGPGLYLPAVFLGEANPFSNPHAVADPGF
jgi:hypothetical protein